MDSSALEQLREIGRQLDADIYPRVFNGGIVAPSSPTVGKLALGVEKRHELQGPTRSATWAWQWSAPGQGSTRRSRSPRDSAPVISEPLRREYLGQLADVTAAYPRTMHWQQKEGLWLSVESALFANLDRRATFIVAVPFVQGAMPKAWGFWTTVISWEWIGPRHTNFPDGSVCAFEPRDGTWVSGGSIVELLDLYSLWALRHLHLRELARWPGRQSVSHSFERIQELQDDELCGCDDANRRYADCCKQADLAENRHCLAADFLTRHSGFQTRQPPTRITQYLVERDNPPSFTERLTHASDF